MSTNRATAYNSCGCVRRGWPQLRAGQYFSRGPIRLELEAPVSAGSGSPEVNEDIHAGGLYHII